MQLVTGKHPGPRRILCYGTPTVGKSTFAASAWRPLILDIEDGLGDIDCMRTPQLKSYEDIVGALSWAAENMNEFDTLCIDTVDWVEHRIQESIAKDAGKKSIGDIPYGKGPINCIPKWNFLIDGLRYLNKAGKTILLLAHEKVETIQPPDSERYDRYEPDLHEMVSTMLVEWCTEVLFANTRVYKKQEDLGFGKVRNIAIGGTERFMLTTQTATAVAKNRLDLPPDMPFDWNEFAKYVPPSARPKPPAPLVTVDLAAPLVEFPPRDEGNIDGVVVNGSSKKQAVA